MKTGLVIGVVFLFVVSTVLFLTLLASSLLGIPVTSTKSLETTSAPRHINVQETDVAAPQPTQPSYVSQETFEAAQKAEALVQDNPYALTHLVTLDGFTFNSILLTLDNGNRKAFDNNTVETDADFVHYTYLGLFPSIGTHLLHYTKKNEEGYLLVDARTGSYITVHGRPFKVPKSPVMLVQDGTTLNVFAKAANRLFTSRWIEPFGPSAIIEVAKESNGTLLLKRQPVSAIESSGYLFERFEPKEVAQLWQDAQENNFTLESNNTL